MVDLSLLRVSHGKQSTQVGSSSPPRAFGEIMHTDFLFSSNVIAAITAFRQQIKRLAIKSTRRRRRQKKERKKATTIKQVLMLRITWPKILPKSRWLKTEDEQQQQQNTYQKPKNWMHIKLCFFWLIYIYGFDCFRFDGTIKESRVQQSESEINVWCFGQRLIRMFHWCCEINCLIYVVCWLVVERTKFDNDIYRTVTSNLAHVKFEFDLVAKPYVSVKLVVSIDRWSLISDLMIMRSVIWNFQKITVIIATKSRSDVNSARLPSPSPTVREDAFPMLICRYILPNFALQWRFADKNSWYVQ